MSQEYKEPIDVGVSRLLWGTEIWLTPIWPKSAISLKFALK